MLTPNETFTMTAIRAPGLTTPTTKSTQSGDKDEGRVPPRISTGGYSRCFGRLGAELPTRIMDAIRAINEGINPELIAQGSSGSYFVRNSNGVVVGVFKPKNEEPYALLNPKWLKWIQKTLSPCCFGRSCLVSNQGYLSEVGASLVDQKLGLNVVPNTAVIALAAPTFNYTRMDRAMARTKKQIARGYPHMGQHFRTVGLPPKIGSFQLFINGFRNAIFWLRQWEHNPDQQPPPRAQHEFKLQFEHLVILDYLIRNTDRGNDNWLIRYEDSNEDDEREAPKGQQINMKPAIVDILKIVKRLKKELGREPAKFVINGKLIDIHEPNSVSVASSSSVPNPSTLQNVEVCIAAIDNGLAFPFKHPDQWRAYPYQWANLPLAQQPFSEETVAKILPLIDDANFVLELGDELRNLFKTDKAFNKKTFAKQISLVRGQMLNLREALRTRKSPAQLAHMTPQYVIEIGHKKQHRLRSMFSLGKSKEHKRMPCTYLGPAGPCPVEEEPKTWQNTFKQKVHTRTPFFAMW